MSADHTDKAGPPVVAYLVPRLMTFAGAVRTSCPPHLQPEFEGEVAWSAKTFSDCDDAVQDKHGTTHERQALITLASHNAAVAALQAERDADRAALEALRGQVAGLVEKWRQPTPQDDCTLYTMGQRTARNKCADGLAEALGND